MISVYAIEKSTITFVQRQKAEFLYIPHNKACKAFYFFIIFSMVKETPQRPIILCGLPRSGSTLLYNLLNMTNYTHQCLPRDQGYRFWQQSLSASQEKPYLLKRVPDIINAAAGEIPDDVPLIITIRDLRDILVSKHLLLETMFGIDDFCIDGDFRYRFNEAAGRPLKNEAGLVQLCQAITAVLNQRTNLLVVHYEDLVSDPDKVQTQLKQIGIDYKDGARFSQWDGHQTAILEENLNGNREIDSTNSQRWKQEIYRTRIDEQFRRFPELFEYLIRFGYETDRSWIQGLEIRRTTNVDSHESSPAPNK